MTENTNIIIFAQMGSGKDSVAQLFIDFCDYKKAKLGEWIRKDVDTYVDLLNIDKSRRRELYVKYGQLKRELFGQDIWCVILNEKYSKDIPKGKVIVADGRQVNEYDYFVKKLGFIPIGIEANAEVRKQRIIERDGYDQSNQFNDDTEIQARKVIQLIKEEETGYIIDNNSTVEDLIVQVKDIVNDITKIQQEKFFNQYC